MSNAAQLKQRKSAAPYQSVDAKSQSEVLKTKDVDMEYSNWFRITGKHAPASGRELLYNFIMEMTSVFILGFVVGLVAFTAGPTTALATAVLVGLAYGLTYYVVCQLPRDHKLRCIANPAYAVFYWLGTNDIGFAGVLYYLVAHTLGSIFSGLALRAILSEQTGGCATSAGCAVLRATVPLAVTTNAAYGFGVSHVTVICMEIFIPAVIALVLGLSEYLNTSSYAVERNYKKATKNAAIATIIFVSAGYPFQMWSFNSSTYLTGLFSGVLLDSTTHYSRTISILATIPGTDFLLNSVWGAGGDAAWALYYFGPIAGGVTAAILFRIYGMIGFKIGSENCITGGRISMRDEKYRNDRVPLRWINNEMEEPLLQASQTVHTSVADLINPYQAQNVATSVL